jgi:hypothetical protein
MIVPLEAPCGRSGIRPHATAQGSMTTETRLVSVDLAIAAGHVEDVPVGSGLGIGN